MESGEPTPEDLVEAVALTGVRDERVLDAVRAVPRHEFVPPGMRSRAYGDEPVPIPRGQVTTQPSLVARMLEALELYGGGGEAVLEVGTGHGYQAAMIAQLVASVWTVERWEDLAEVARWNLARCGVANARVVIGDGSEGLPEHAPYDAVVVAAAFPEVPGPLIEQLRVGGRLVQPIGSGGDEEG